MLKIEKISLIVVSLHVNKKKLSGPYKVKIKSINNVYLTQGLLRFFLKWLLGISVSKLSMSYSLNKIGQLSFKDHLSTFGFAETKSK